MKYALTVYTRKSSPYFRELDRRPIIESHDGVIVIHEGTKRELWIPLSILKKVTIEALAESEAESKE